MLQSISFSKICTFFESWLNEACYSRLSIDKFFLPYMCWTQEIPAQTFPLLAVIQNFKQSWEPWLNTENKTADIHQNKAYLLELK